MAPRAYIGTSGWNYKHWRNLIYPPKFAQKNWLGFIAEQFDTVEVNTSFYRIPESETVAAWQEATPARFKFALKLWRGITHYKKLINAAEFTRRFLDVAECWTQRARSAADSTSAESGKDLAKLDTYLGS